MAGVEKARARVRELTPLIFCFDLPIISSLESTTDPNDPFLRAIQDQYNVQVTQLTNNKTLRNVRNFELKSNINFHS